MSSNATPTLQEALFKACSLGDIAELDILLDEERGEEIDEHGDHPDPIDAAPLLAEATRNRNPGIIELLLHRTSITTFSRDLIWSAIDASLDTYKLYLAKSPDILAYNWQGIGDVVCYVLTRNERDFLSYLLNIGADPGRSLESSARYAYVFLPIEFCAFSSNVLNARLLIEHGAVVVGTKAVQLATQYGRLDMVRLLIELGGDVNAKLDPKSLYAHCGHIYGTPLHYALEGRHTAIVRFLFEHGADANARDTAGKTVMMKAREIELGLKEGDAEIVEMLRTLGAK